MTGRVEGRHALLPVTFRVSGQADLTIEFVVDTGFTDYLTLPPAAIAALGLPFLHQVAADLADDSTVQMAVHVATVLWNDAVREVPVLATGRRPLLGTAMLEEQELVAQFRENGLVTVEDL